MSNTRQKVSDYFEKLRFDRAHHLGLGDIRLTMAQQEELLELGFDTDWEQRWPNAETPASSDR